MSDRTGRWRLAVLTGVLLAFASVIPSDPATVAAAACPRRCGAKATSARRGRPRKFDVPSRAITLTLPEHVIAALQAIDADTSRAIVRAVEATPAGAAPAGVELASYGTRAVIIVPQNRALQAHTGAELVPLADGRALILLEAQVSAAEFELRMGDALADPALAGLDRALFEKIADILRSSRQSEGVEIEERSLIVVRWTQPRESRRLA